MTNKKYEGIKQEQMTRTTVIQSLIATYNLKSYLEIGVQESANGSQINVEYKVGVDIKKPKNADQHYNKFYEGKSRDFFKSNNSTYDLIFIDGDHSFDEVLNDFAEAITITNRFVVLHDAYPAEKEATRWPNTTKYGTYNGEVYKLLLAFHTMGIPYKLYKFDHGVLVIDKYEWDIFNDVNTFKADKEYDFDWQMFEETKFITTGIGYAEDFNHECPKEESLSSLDVAKVATEVEVKETKKRKPMSQETKDKIKAAKNKNK